jgi:hypothetical protein
VRSRSRPRSRAGPVRRTSSGRALEPRADAGPGRLNQRI